MRTSLISAYRNNGINCQNRTLFKLENYDIFLRVLKIHLCIRQLHILTARWSLIITSTDPNKPLKYLKLCRQNRIFHWNTWNYIDKPLYSTEILEIISTDPYNPLKYLKLYRQILIFHWNTWNYIDSPL